MKWNKHLEIEGEHAFLSGSNYHWVNYNEDKLIKTYSNLKKKEEGTQLHDLAARLITRKIKLDQIKKAFNMHVNDAIGFNMDPEVMLYYSPYAFGTADAISFNNNILRIHDLKTGTIPAKFIQLDIYAALFFLEYNIDPENVQIIERIYQGYGFIENIPDIDTIKDLMNKIKYFSSILDDVSKEL